MATQEQWYVAGSVASAWFRKLAPKLRRARTDEQHVLENEILDLALADAGIIPREFPGPVELFAHVH